MVLRPYQQECIDTIEAQPSGAYLVQMATGLGKTVTFANIPRYNGRMLILSHRTVQASFHLRQLRHKAVQH